MKDAVVIVIQKQDRFLFIRRAEHKEGAGYWCPISGKVESGENQAQTVEREAKEEVGILLKAIKKVWECPSSCGNYRLHWWSTRIVNDSIKIGSAEVAELRWVTLSEINQLSPTFSSDMYFFNKIL